MTIMIAIIITIMKNITKTQKVITVIVVKMTNNKSFGNDNKDRSYD